MKLEEARNLIIEADAEIKTIWPDAWCMFICTVAGHIQFVAMRPNHHPFFTCDIPAAAPDWLDRFKDGAESLRMAIYELAAKYKEPAN